MAPVELRGDRHRLSVRAGRRGTARLVLDDLRDPDEVGPHAQRRLQQEYAAVSEPVDPDLVYLQSYTGSRPTDSPLAIHAEPASRPPDMRVQWGVADRACGCPRAPCRC